MNSLLTANNEDAVQEDDKFLLFRLADQLYAAPLVSIREIIKMQNIKPVPFMVPYFRGIINIRGSIISVIDLRLKLKLLSGSLDHGILVVIESKNGSIAAVVDDVVSVKNFSKKDIETNIALETEIPMEFFIGVARINDKLVNVIDIGSVLSVDEFASVRRMSDAGISA